MKAVEVSGLTKHFESFTLDGVTFSADSGCIIGLVGENGAGKSTTIKLILNMLKKDSGNVKLFGKDNSLADMNEIGVVFDECCFHEALSANEINKIMKNFYTKWDEKEFFSLCQKFDLPLKRKIKEYSRGMKMKISIAAALSHNARLLILDEPTSGLDPVVRDEILDIFYDFISDENRTIIISSHIVSDLEKICDYIAFMHKGKMILFEEKDTLLGDCCIINCAESDFEKIDKNDIIGFRKTQSGISAVIRKSGVPQNSYVQPVSLEDLFVYMIRGCE